MNQNLPPPPAAFYFQVVINGADDTDDSSFQEVSGISSELETEEVSEGGENRFKHRLPSGTKHPALVLKRGIAASSSALVAWCRDVFEGDFVKPVTAHQVDVKLLDRDRNPVRSWSFTNAFPIKWEVDSFNSTKNEVAIETIELSYTVSERKI